MKLSPYVMLRVCFVLLLGAVAFGLAVNLPLTSGGRPAQGPANDAARVPPLRFVIVAPQLEHPFWTEVGQGARIAGQSLSVNVEFTGPRRASIDDQVQLLDMATAAQVDGIITQGVPSPQVAEAIAKAVDRGIPVVTIDTDLPGRRLTYVGPDNYKAGRLVAEELIRRTGGKAVVGIVRGLLGPEEEDLRVKGFREGLAGAPGVRIVRVESSDLNRSVAGEKALAILREHPDVTAFYGTTALDAVGIAQSVSAIGAAARVLVFGWDSVGETEDYLSRGAISVVVAHDPGQMGARAVEILEAYLRHDNRPPSAQIMPVTLKTRGGTP